VKDTANLKIENVTRKFGKTTALNNVTLNLEDKDFVALLGPSGCGKTTLMRCIAGLDKPDTGGIYMDGQKINDLPPQDRDIALVFQFYAVYPGTNVFGNIAFPLWARKIPADEVKRRVTDTAERLGIGHLLEQKMSKLNVGEKQRVGLARALVRQPKMFLLDEPLTNMDARLRLIVRGELKRIVKDTGLTAIVVSHDQLEAMTMADKIAVMNAGRILQYDTVDNVYHDPNCLFVADFLGSPGMNLIPATLTQKNEMLCLDTGAFTLDVSQHRELIREKTTNSELVLGIRPERIRISDEKDKDAIVGKIDRAELMGDKQNFITQIANVRINVLSPTVLDYEDGDNIHLRLPMEYIHIFDKTSEMAIL
jgi:ABC-type sugar transport system ATPase subunit